MTKSPLASIATDEWLWSPVSLSWPIGRGVENVVDVDKEFVRIVLDVVVADRVAEISHDATVTVLIGSGMPGLLNPVINWVVKIDSRQWASAVPWPPVFSTGTPDAVAGS